MKVYASILAVLTAALPARAQPPHFNRDVRPILAENCFPCHGPDSAARKADLRLDRREDAIQAGAIIPGKPHESGLIERIFAEEAGRVMPPPKVKKTLSAAQKETLKRWVETGAEYQPHWSFIAPARPASPKVGNPSWVRNPIDAFVLAALEAKDLRPSTEADRRSLARRLSLDLVGLPPEPADVEAFVNDASPDYYERYVDKLVASPHWGEHRGRYWLDAARYADTHGIHFDNYREMWSYRDWVIGAFNRNLPFDRFTVEQLAGDLLPGRTLEQQIATGFNRCNITTNEGGAIDEEYLVLYARDRTETTAQVWLGLTAGCAACHDHKFDPVSQKEFYALSAFFNNTTQKAMDGNVKDTPPVLPVLFGDDRPRHEGLMNRLEAAKAKVADRRSAAKAGFEAWLAKTTPTTPYELAPKRGLRFHAPLDEGEGRTARAAVDGVVRPAALPAGLELTTSKLLNLKAGGDGPAYPDVADFEKDQPFTVALRVTAASQNGAVLGRMSPADGHRGWDIYVDGNRPAFHLIHRWPGDAIKVIGRSTLRSSTPSHVVVTYDGSGKAAGLLIYVNGVVQAVEVAADSLESTTRTAVPFKLGGRHTGERAVGAAIGDVRLFDRALSAAEVDHLAKAPRAAELVVKADRTAKENDELYDWWLDRFDGSIRELKREAAALAGQEAALRARGTVAHVMNENAGEATAHVLKRGEYDKRQDAVKPATPAALPAYGDDLPRNRLGLARWLVRSEHPLTARVTVNRFWQELFGAGLVKTAGDFGIAGELPSHPELLDWLAVEFREGGWDVKTFFKLAVTSSTYRQAAIATPEKLAADPDNRLLSRGPRFRMDAEMVRDHALAASGILVPKLGGPSVKPYQPDGVWEAVAMIGSDTRDYKRDAGEALYRRGLYTFWKRAAPPATLEVFNAPNRETCTVRRERTNTPLQALVTLNDTQFVEAARFLAGRALKAEDSQRRRIDFITARLIARTLSAAEYEIVAASLDQLLADFRAKPVDAAKLIAVGESKPDSTLDPPTLAAWTMLVNQLMNLDEVLAK